MKIGIIVLIAAGVVGGLIWFGVLTPSQVEQAARKARGDVTKVVDNIAAPTDQQANNPAAAKQCRANLKSIESAKRAVASEKGNSIGVVSVAEVKKHLGGSMPRCPAGGEYNIGTLQHAASCSIGGNNTTTISSDDHEISGF
jgi:hypothetical protein